MKHIISLLTILLFVTVTSQSQFVYNENQRRGLDELYASQLFKGGNAYYVSPADDPTSQGSLTIFQYLQGRIPGLQINNSRMYAPFVQFRMSTPAFFLDEMRVDASVLATLNINDIGLVKVFRPPFMPAIGGGPGGAVAVYTLTGEDEEE
ncbi:MAG: hypothetical protein H7Y31_08045 [Chitinophagaceae bacterium]|nr:hypothetical protein [Chitinophagaceae bacterium]